MIKYLIFDAGGVLVYPRLGQWHIPYRAAQILGRPRSDDLSTDAFDRAMDACMGWLGEDRIVADVETERWLRRGFVLELDRLMGWHMTDREIADMTDDFTDDIDRYGFFDDLREYLSRWRETYTLGLLSDAMPSVLVYLEQSGLSDMFEQKVISTQVGAIKPSPRMYGEILRRLGAAAGECLFVDDRIGNVRGAVAMGMQAVQMSRPEFPAEELWDGPVVHSFQELDVLLREGAHA